MAFINDLSKVLTPREHEVALLVIRGLSNKAVAHALGVSPGTIKLHLHRTFQKLGVKSRHALAVLVVAKPDDHRVKGAYTNRKSKAGMAQL
jgi:DNA-binding NarL/FixJ family response regulator